MGIDVGRVDVRWPAGPPADRRSDDQPPDLVAGMLRLADRAVYGIAAAAAGLSALLVGPAPWSLLLILLSVAPLGAWACGLRVPVAVAAPVNIVFLTALILVDAPKTALLIPVTFAAWVALRSASLLLNTFMVVSVLGLSILDFGRRPALGHDSYLSSGSIIWLAAAMYGTAIGFVLRRTGVLAAELSRAQHQLIAAAATDERRRIAQDVHDLVAHSLAVALLNITGARRAMRYDPALADEALARAEEVGRDSLAGIRRVVGLLGDADTDRSPGERRAGGDAAAGDGAGGRAAGGRAAGAADGGPLTARSGPLPDAHDLAELVDGYRRGGLPVDLVVTGHLDGIDQVAGTVLFRTVREALANVLHHAGGVATRVSVDVLGNEVVVGVMNDLADGGAVDPAGGSGGMGLRGITERVHALGGSFAAGPRDGRWVLRASIPTVADQLVPGGTA